MLSRFKAQVLRGLSQPLGDGALHGAWSCYKTGMPKTNEHWLLFKYVGVELTPLSKPFKTRAQAEKARMKYSERERRAIGVGVIRTTTWK
jgi:hypothetical protein